MILEVVMCSVINLIFGAGEYYKLWYCYNRTSIWFIGMSEYCFNICCWIVWNDRKQASLESICLCYGYHLRFVFFWGLIILYPWPCFENV